MPNFLDFFSKLLIFPLVELNQNIELVTVPPVTKSRRSFLPYSLKVPMSLQGSLFMEQKENMEEGGG